MVGGYHLALCCLILILGVFAVTHGQVAEDLDFIMAHNPIEPIRKKDSPAFAFNDTNELRLAFMGLIRIYQWFISTQDMPACNFTPSCSRFGMAALKQYGILHGILMTSDRLQRCHGRGRTYYTIHPETGKCDDPVEHSFLGDE